MKVFWLDLLFRFRLLLYYIPLLVGKSINWKKINYALFKRKHVSIKSIGYINGEIYIVNVGSIAIGENFQANSGTNYNPIGGDTVLRFVTYLPSAKIIIGNNVGISNSTICCYNRVEIEDDVMLGGGVKIWDTNFHSLDPEIRVSGNDTDIKTAPIKICRRAFIGAGTIILKGVTIGQNSVIAAGSVVVKDIPDNVIAAGNPCRVVKDI